MSEIQFDEDNDLRSSFKSRTILGAPSTPRMVQVLLKTGLVKDEKKAGNLLLGIAVLCFILSALIAYLYIFNGFSQQRTLTPIDIESVKTRRERAQKSLELRNQVRENINTQNQ